jgi:hypothetical protein
MLITQVTPFCSGYQFCWLDIRITVECKGYSGVMCNPDPSCYIPALSSSAVYACIHLNSITPVCAASTVSCANNLHAHMYS